MHLFDFFKKKKKEEVKKRVEGEGEKVKVREELKSKKEEVSVPQEKAELTKGMKREIKVAPLALKTPHITEKAVDLAEKNQYIFKVFKRANKEDLKKAIKEVYGVDVLKVRIINVPAKKKRLGRTSGWQSGYKKAMVAIKKGQIIEILPR